MSRNALSLPQRSVARLARAVSSLALVGVTACVVSTHGGVGAPIDVPPVPKVVSLDPEPETRPGSKISEPMRQERITARHILVSYRGALRAAPSVLRSREEAFARATEALKRAKAGDPFEALVEEYSDDLGSAARGGSLGEFGREDMVGEFSDAAFKLKPGELSNIVETQFGFHVILRTQ